MKRTRRWIFLTLAAALAVLIGGRVHEAVGLDMDTLQGAS